MTARFASRFVHHVQSFPFQILVRNELSSFPFSRGLDHLRTSPDMYVYYCCVHSRPYIYGICPVLLDWLDPHGRLLMRWYGTGVLRHWLLMRSDGTSRLHLPLLLELFAPPFWWVKFKAWLLYWCQKWKTMQLKEETYLVHQLYLGTTVQAINLVHVIEI